MALRAAHKAGEIIVQSFQRIDTLKIEVKQKNDYVTQVDRASEDIILQILKKAYPTHSFLGEESGLHPGKGKGNEYQWIIDPLDGTKNFIHGIPHFAISIACLHRGKLEHAVIFDPINNEEFHASRGGGAYLNTGRLRVSKEKGLQDALLGTGFPFREEQKNYSMHYHDMLQLLSHKAAGVRRFGAAALDLAYVAAGRLDGFWELGLKPWDIAAGCLLVIESGGLVGDLRGENTYLESGHLVCGTPKCFQEILQHIQPWAQID